MDIIKNIFNKKSVNYEKLTAYGFLKNADIYSYCTVLSESGFTMTVNISEGRINTAVTDPALNEIYTLHLADSAAGGFVGGVKTQYEAVLNDIADKCFEPDVFKSTQAKEIISHIRTTYGDELEYLWAKTSDNAVVRRKDNKKWYAVLLTVSRRKLGIDSDEMVEIIDLKMKPEDIEIVADSEKYFLGYHMNKKHWITICLDDSVSTQEICTRIDESYRLAV